MRPERFDALIDSGALALGAAVLADERLEPGRIVSQYRIVEEIGRGGMGVVYRAFDTTLERDVALKILLTGQPLLDEARAAARLQHPNVGTVYELGESEGVTYLAMELLEGESLRERLAHERLERSEALEIASRIADGLAHAHDNGITHRDLKPANVMLTAHGPKIIDFGLAGDEGGLAMGTPGYASPEQLRGERGDARSDVYSLGVVLNEILGSRVARVVDRCLAIDPSDRFQTAAEVNDAVRRAASSRATLPWVAAAMVLGAIGASVVLLRSESGAVTLTNPQQVTSDVGVEEHASWSPDGRILAYDANGAGERDIWLAELDARPTNRTASFAGAARYPSWSPNGEEIAFWSDAADGDGSVMLMRAVDGEPRHVVRTDTEGTPAWSGDGSALLIVNGNQAERVTLDGEILETIELPGDNARRFALAWSHDGRYLAYVDANATVDEVTKLWVVRIGDSRSHQLTDGQTNVWSPSWSPDAGALYFVSNRGGGMDVWRQRFGDDGPEGEPEQLTVGVGVRDVASSADGQRLAYSKGRRVANVWRVPLGERPSGWRDAEQLTFDQALIEFVDVSPDGGTLVVSSDRSGNQDLWQLPSAGGELTQLTSDPTPDWSPVFSPDGHSIAFYAYRSGNRDIWMLPRPGGPAHRVTEDPAEDYRMSFSPDGRTLVFDSTRSGSWDIWSIDLDDGKTRTITNHEAIDSDARFSPDGSRLVFGSLRTGSYRLWEIRGDADTPVQLSKGPGRNPRFSPDGLYVLFHGDGERSGDIWRLELASGDERAVTKLEGRRGILGTSALATDGEYVYFSWEEDLGDLWVLDVEQRSR